MSELICQENKLANKYLFESITTSSGKQIAKISKENVAKAEAILLNDSAYYRSTNKEANPVKGFENKNSSVYKGSSAFWLTQLAKRCAEKATVEFQWTDEEIIQYAVNAIDRENSTHLNADGVGREEIGGRIIDAYRNRDFLELLKNQNGEYELYELIREDTNPKDENKKSRTNPSFASKFCHYASYYFFEGMPEQDGYSIWDSVIRNNLALYIEHLQIKQTIHLQSYKDYQQAIDLIREEAEKQWGELVSRNGFDHLLWLYFKGRIHIN